MYKIPSGHLNFAIQRENADTNVGNSEYERSAHQAE